MDRILKRAAKTRGNWLEAFKVACNIHGYNYYEIPGELRYRYPAPGSCALDRTSHPHLFKRHWKTPYRDSNLNIRPKEKKISWADDADHHISKVPKLDPAIEYDAEQLKKQQPPLDDLTEVIGDRGADYYESEEMLAALRADFETHQDMRVTD